jgi:ribosome-binding factor A
MGHDQGAGGHRHARLQQIIHEELDATLRGEASDPALDGVRVTTVELSVDYKSARVRFLINDGSAATHRTERALERATPFLRSRLGEALDLKRTPTLRFVYDREAAASERAARLIEEPDEGDDPCRR